jgi:hypothetical protein
MHAFRIRRLAGRPPFATSGPPTEERCDGVCRQARLAFPLENDARDLS